ncbi:hypothetical protein EVJ30_04705 [Exiguobacterium sp. SH5S13]|uniref:hypothetical protein n=1 Tax=Exiguobacterium sp. SH5S13 TaxID=2510959 RepID=UPI00103FB231|nr:hypothetical protein [Exiguobacterium sp. SH5S13]TCI56192.1 hypothetical protein EVJ30_04705 [Exiguobacterium sp. SH5S13]
MTKQERINVIYKMTQKLAWARSALVIVMMFCVFSIQRLEQGSVWYIVGTASCLLFISVVLGYESRFAKSLTSKHKAKQIITKQYVYDFAVIPLLIFIYLLTGRLGVMWLGPVLVIGVIIGFYRIQRKLEDQLTRADPEHPIRRDIKLSNVRD